MAEERKAEERMAEERKAEERMAEERQPTRQPMTRAPPLPPLCLPRGIREGEVINLILREHSVETYRKVVHDVINKHTIKKCVPLSWFAEKKGITVEALKERLANTKMKPKDFELKDVVCFEGVKESPILNELAALLEDMSEAFHLDTIFALVPAYLLLPHVRALVPLQMIPIIACYNWWKLGIAPASAVVEATANVLANALGKNGRTFIVKHAEKVLRAFYMEDVLDNENKFCKRMYGVRKRFDATDRMQWWAPREETLWLIGIISIAHAKDLPLDWEVLVRWAGVETDDPVAYFIELVRKYGAPRSVLNILREKGLIKVGGRRVRKERKARNGDEIVIGELERMSDMAKKRIPAPIKKAIWMYSSLQKMRKAVAKYYKPLHPPKREDMDVVREKKLTWAALLGSALLHLMAVYFDGFAAKVPKRAIERPDEWKSEAFIESDMYGRRVAAWVPVEVAKAIKIGVAAVKWRDVDLWGDVESWIIDTIENAYDELFGEEEKWDAKVKIVEKGREAFVSISPVILKRWLEIIDEVIDKYNGDVNTFKTMYALALLYAGKRALRGRNEEVARAFKNMGRVTLMIKHLFGHPAANDYAYHLKPDEENAIEVLKDVAKVMRKEWEFVRALVWKWGGMTRSADEGKAYVFDERPTGKYVPPRARTSWGARIVFSKVSTIVPAFEKARLIEVAGDVGMTLLYAKKHPESVIAKSVKYLARRGEHLSVLAGPFERLVSSVARIVLGFPFTSMRSEEDVEIVWGVRPMPGASADGGEVELLVRAAEHYERTRTLPKSVRVIQAHQSYFMTADLNQEYVDRWVKRRRKDFVIEAWTKESFELLDLAKAWRRGEVKMEDVWREFLKLDKRSLGELVGMLLAPLYPSNDDVAIGPHYLALYEYIRREEEGAMDPSLYVEHVIPDENNAEMYAKGRPTTYDTGFLAVALSLKRAVLKELVRRNALDYVADLIKETMAPEEEIVSLARFFGFPMWFTAQMYMGDTTIKEFLEAIMNNTLHEYILSMERMKIEYMKEERYEEARKEWEMRHEVSKIAVKKYFMNWPKTVPAIEPQ